MKQCSNCEVLRPDDQFYQRSDRPGVLHSWCIVCTKELRVSRNVAIAAYQKRRRADRNTEEKRVEKDYQLRYNFDLTLAAYNAMLEAQDYVCAICGKENGTDAHSGEKTKQLSVDHDHETGAVRGLLCFRCNTSIETLTVPGVLHRAVEYLRRAEG